MKKTHTSTHCLANNLLFLLEKNSVTPNQLAQALNLPLMTIRRLLSGETEDPRVSTLKSIADYFEVSIDFLIQDHTEAQTMFEQKIKSYRIPKISWESLENLDTLSSTSLKHAEQWEPVFISHPVSANTFALESKPSMYPRFPRGTLFVIDPALPPKDGDVVLVHFKKDHSYTLKELIIDPPEMRLNPLVTDSRVIDVNLEDQVLLGVVVATLFYQC